MAVYGHDVTHADVVFRRKEDNRHALRWRSKDIETGEMAPVNPSGKSFTVRLYDPTTGNWWASWGGRAVDAAAGTVVFGPRMSVFEGSQWEHRDVGHYEVTVVRDGETTLLLEGLARIV